MPHIIMLLRPEANKTPTGAPRAGYFSEIMILSIRKGSKLTESCTLLLLSSDPPKWVPMSFLGIGSCDLGKVFSHPDFGAGACALERYMVARHRLDVDAIRSMMVRYFDVFFGKQIPSFRDYICRTNHNTHSTLRDNMKRERYMKQIDFSFYGIKYMKFNVQLRILESAAMSSSACCVHRDFPLSSSIAAPCCPASLKKFRYLWAQANVQLASFSKLACAQGPLTRHPVARWDWKCGFMETLHMSSLQRQNAHARGAEILAQRLSGTPGRGFSQ